MASGFSVTHVAVSLKENNWFFVMDQTPRPYLTRSLPAQLIEKPSQRCMLSSNHCWELASLFSLLGGCHWQPDDWASKGK
jgi:hypothetical protein